MTLKNEKHIKNRHFSIWSESYSAESDTPISGKKRTIDEAKID